MHLLGYTAQRARKEAQLSRALKNLVAACDAFIDGAGCDVEVNLDYCAALAQVEQATEQGKKVLKAQKPKHYKMSF